VGDIKGGIALLKLTRLYEQTNEVGTGGRCLHSVHTGGWVGDIEGGIALLKLARLYERTSEADQPAAAYTQYIQVGGWVILREVLPS
jgi:hypothetical protein